MPRPRARRKGKRQRFYARNTVNTTLPRRVGRFDAIVLGRSGQFPLSDQNSPGADELRRRSLRHAGAPVCLCGDAGACLPSSASISGTNCTRQRDWRSRRQGRLERGQPLAPGVRRQPTRSIRKIRGLRLSSGIPRAAARTSSAGPARTKSRPLNSKSIASAANSTRRSRPAADIAARMTSRRPGAGGRRRHRQQIRHA